MPGTPHEKGALFREPLHGCSLARTARLDPTRVGILLRSMHGAGVAVGLARGGLCAPCPRGVLATIRVTRIGHLPRDRIVGDGVESFARRAADTGGIPRGAQLEPKMSGPLSGCIIGP